MDRPDAIVEYTASSALSLIRDVRARYSGDTGLSETFKGCCGLTQCMIAYACEDVGIIVHPIATQSLTRYWQGHAALSIPGDCNGAPPLLIDPTFIQFGEGNSKGVREPGYFVRRTAAGRHLHDSLKSKGFAEFSEAGAAAYVSSFCQGDSGLSDAAAYAFLTTPPPHPFHLCFAPDDDRYSRRVLAQQGLTITIPKPR